MQLLNQISSVLGKPLAVEKGHADTMLALISSMVTGKVPVSDFERKQVSSEVLAFEHGSNTPTPSGDVGIAVIPIHGSMAHRGSFFEVGYDDIKSEITAAMQDPEIDGVLLDMDTNGGEVAGLGDTCKWMQAASEVKPIWTVVNEHAYSAGCQMSCATDRIIATESAGLGSIGVIMMHADMSKMLEDVGIDITLIAKGEYKTMGNPYEPLSKEYLDMYKASLEGPYDRFCGFVAESRDIDIDVVKGTEAATMGASMGKQLGLIDDVMSADSAVAEFAEHLRSKKTTNKFGDIRLSKETVTEPDGDSVKSYEDGLAEGKKLGAIAEGERITAILELPEAKGKSASAWKLIKRGLSAEEAADWLGDMKADEGSQVVEQDDKDELGETMNGSRQVKETNRIKADVESEDDLEEFGERQTKNQAAVASLTSRLKQAGKKA